MNHRYPMLVAALVLSLILLFSATGPSWACSSFMLHKGEILVFGHNLNEGDIGVPGMLFINKRGVFKTGRTWSELINKDGANPSSLDWISRYGSVTVNCFGRDFPDGGINEAGLFIWEMNEEGEYPKNDEFPRLMHMNWMQFVLDNCSTVDDVLENAAETEIDGWPWHYFVGDAAGNCAALAFVGGEVVVNRGESMPVPGLFNTLYDREMELLKYFDGFGGSYEPVLDDSAVPRFVKTAVMVRDFDPTQDAVAYGLQMLENLTVSDVPEWSVLCDVRGRGIYFKTRVNPALKRLSLDDIDFSSTDPVLVLNIDQQQGGDVRYRLHPYTDREMREFLESLTRIPELPAAFFTSGGLTVEEFVTRFTEHWHRALSTDRQHFAGVWETIPGDSEAALSGRVVLQVEQVAVSGEISNSSGSVDRAPLQHLNMVGDRLSFTFRTASGSIMEARGVLEGETMALHLWGIEESYGQVVFRRRR
jgi:penicillin V acylase-like amidase (Ntn superfamily)